METSYGLKFELLKEINPQWDDYNKTVAECHLQNAGVIIVDPEYQTPIDNEYDLDEIYSLLETQGSLALSGNIQKLK